MGSIQWEESNSNGKAGETLSLMRFTENKIDWMMSYEWYIV